MDNQTPIIPSPVSQNPEKQAKMAKMKEGMHKTLAVVGLVFVLGLASVSIIKIAPAVIRGVASGAVSLSSIFVPAQKQPLAVSTTATTVSNGQQFTLSWTAPNSEEGSYEISYPCIDQFHIEAVGATEAQSGNTIVYCNTAFQFLNNNGNSLTLAGYIAQGSPSPAVNVPITVYFTQNGATSVTAESTLTMAVNAGAVATTPNAATAPSATTAPNTSTIPNAVAKSQTTSNQQSPQALTPGQQTTSTYTVPSSGSTLTSGGSYTPGTNADLAAHILATGIIDPTTNVFTPEDTVDVGNKVAIQFEIANQGGRATGPWSFAVVLPTYPAYTFLSNSQPSLNPGDKIQYTISFDQIEDQTGGDTFTVNADNTDEVNETNKSNNIATGTIYVAQ